MTIARIIFSGRICSSQKPEWKIFIQFLKSSEISLGGDEIKAWIFSLRKNLDKIDAKDIVHSESGRGKGYLLQGHVKFKNKI